MPASWADSRSFSPSARDLSPKSALQPKPSTVLTMSVPAKRNRSHGLSGSRSARADQQDFEAIGEPYGESKNRECGVRVSAGWKDSATGYEQVLDGVHPTL